VLFFFTKLTLYKYLQFIVSGNMRKFLKNVLICALTLGFVGVGCSSSASGSGMSGSSGQRQEQGDNLMRTLISCLPKKVPFENEKNTEVQQNIKDYYAKNPIQLEALKQEINVPDMGLIETYFKDIMVEICKNTSLNATESDNIALLSEMTDSANPKKVLMMFLKKNSKDIANKILNEALKLLRFSDKNGDSLAGKVEFIAQQIKGGGQDDMITKLFREAISIIAIDSIPELSSAETKEKSKSILNIVRSGVASLPGLIGKFVDKKEQFASPDEIEQQFNIVADAIKIISDRSYAQAKEKNISTRLDIDTALNASNQILQLLKFRFAKNLTPFIGDVYTPDRLSIYTGRKYLYDSEKVQTVPIKDQVYDFIRQMHDERYLELYKFSLLVSYFKIRDRIINQNKRNKKDLLSDNIASFNKQFANIKFFERQDEQLKKNKAKAYSKPIDSNYLNLIKQEFMLFYAIFLEASKRFSQNKISNMEKKIGLTEGNPTAIEKLSKNDKIRIALAASGIDSTLIGEAVATYKTVSVEAPSTPRGKEPSKYNDDEKGRPSGSTGPGSDRDTSSTSSSGSSGDRMPTQNTKRKLSLDEEKLRPNPDDSSFSVTSKLAIEDAKPDMPPNDNESYVSARSRSGSQDSSARSSISSQVNDNDNKSYASALSRSGSQISFRSVDDNNDLGALSNARSVNAQPDEKPSGTSSGQTTFTETGKAQLLEYVNQFQQDYQQPSKNSEATSSSSPNDNTASNVPVNVGSGNPPRYPNNRRNRRTALQEEQKQKKNDKQKAEQIQREAIQSERKLRAPRIEREKRQAEKELIETNQNIKNERELTREVRKPRSYDDSEINYRRTGYGNNILAIEDAKPMKPNNGPKFNADGTIIVPSGSLPRTNQLAIEDIKTAPLDSNSEYGSARSRTSSQTSFFSVDENDTSEAPSEPVQYSTANQSTRSINPEIGVTYVGRKLKKFKNAKAAIQFRPQTAAGENRKPTTPLS
jgi:hypothetical protein